MAKGFVDIDVEHLVVAKGFVDVDFDNIAVANGFVDIGVEIVAVAKVSFTSSLKMLLWLMVSRT